MNHRTITLASLLCVTAFPVIAASSAFAFDKGATDGVVGVLQKKYTLTALTADKTQVTHDGVQLSLKQSGVYSTSCKNFVFPDNKVEDGKVGKQNVFISATLTKMHAHVLQTGEKIYVTKIESKADGKNDILKFTVASVEDIDGGEGSERYCATVSYKLKKGLLNEGSPDDIEQTVETVLAPGDDSGGNSKLDSASNSAAASAPNPAPAPASAPVPVQAAAPRPSAPAAAPAPLSIGESSSQVLQSYGMPSKIVDLGKKKTFFYKDLKIIFTDDKISDMQPL